MAGEQRLPGLPVPARLGAPASTLARVPGRAVAAEYIDVARVGHVPPSYTEEGTAILIHRGRSFSPPTSCAVTPQDRGPRREYW
jgi:hypothetical protein